MEQGKGMWGNVGLETGQGSCGLGGASVFVQDARTAVQTIREGTRRFEAQGRERRCSFTHAPTVSVLAVGSASHGSDCSSLQVFRDAATFLALTARVKLDDGSRLLRSRHLNFYPCRPGGFFTVADGMPYTRRGDWGLIPSPLLLRKGFGIHIFSKKIHACVYTGCRTLLSALSLLSLVSAHARTKGKREAAVCHNFCCVLFVGHTAKSLVAVCHRSRHTVYRWHTATSCSPCATLWTHDKQNLRRVSPNRHTVNWLFVMCWHTANNTIPQRHETTIRRSIVCRVPR